MTLTDLINKGEKVVYDTIFKGTIAFPHSNDVMQIGILGAAPFLAGKYASEFVANRLNANLDSNLIGFASAALAETLWLNYVGPRSPYFHHGDNFSHVKGIVETGIGAGLAYLLTNLKR